MFTGIIETLGRVTQRKEEEGNIHFGIAASFLPELKIDQSIAHNGVCLTVTEIHEDHYSVTAIAETLRKTNLSRLIPGDLVNLERCMKLGDRLDGHMVQGHVDTTAVCAKINDENGSKRFFFTYDKNAGFTVPKGSICVNGVSLTVAESKPGEFSVAIIPHTLKLTNFHLMKPGYEVNVEFDILGKYISALLENR
ncbi:MAG TPA: riboflavin synthase [Bacteroidia bacterium]|nr:riboflavin synthase [Bacteroidia bacterium]